MEKFLEKFFLSINEIFPMLFLVKRMQKKKKWENHPELACLLLFT